MRKLYVQMIALLAALLLAGCGASSQEPQSTLLPSDSVDATAETEIAGQVQENTEEQVEEEVVTLGRIEGGTYTNSYAGIGCELDSNWTFYSAEELQDLPENFAEMFEGTEVGDTASLYTQITDMMAENVDEMTMVNVLYVKLPFAERVLYSQMSDQDMIDAMLMQTDLLTEGYEQIDMTDITYEPTTTMFLGEERPALKTSAMLADVPYYVLQVFDYRIGAYGVVVTASSFVEDHTQEVMQIFYPVD